MYEIDIAPISFLLSYNLRQSYAGKGHKPAVSSPEDRRDSKFVINPDRFPDNYRQCGVFWDLVKFPSVISVDWNFRIIGYFICSMEFDCQEVCSYCRNVIRTLLILTCEMFCFSSLRSFHFFNNSNTRIMIFPVCYHSNVIITERSIAYLRNYN